MKTNNMRQGGEAASHFSGRALQCVLILSILVFFHACSTLSGNKQNLEDLTRAVEAFNTALRWGDFKTASALVAPDLQEQFWKQMDIFEKNMRLTEVDVRNISLAADRESAPVIVRYKYYVTRNPQLRTATVRQTWHYFEKAQGWQLTHTGLEALTSP